MAYNFDDPKAHAFTEGALFLGRDNAGNEIGIRTEVHAITIGGSGSGKGVGLLVQNARRWPQNLLCIDPKGENAMLSWQAREARGQKVAILDPFYQIPKGSIPDRLRLRINPLASIDPASPRARAHILALGNGMIVNHDPKHMEWTDTARKITAGIIAWVVADAPPEYRTLERVRHVLRQTREELYADAQRMAAHDGLGGLVRQAGNIMISAMAGKDGVEKGALALAQRATSWLDDDAIAGVLSEPEGGQARFAMEDLKTAPASLFLVLPPDYVMDYSGFLRLFVKAALSAMGAPVTHGRECLFLLDEFFSLGKLDELTEAAGRMRSYGVHLWPFLQSLTQLTSLYGREGAQTFLVNAAAHIFLGNDQDSDALEHISRRLGVTNSKDIGELHLPDGSHIGRLAYDANRTHTRSPVDPKAGWINLLNSMGDSFAESSIATAKAEYQNAERAYRQDVDRARAEYDHRRAAIGTRRLEPQEVAQLIGKGEGEALARSMIVFMAGGKVLNLAVAPYFEEKPHVLSGQILLPASTHNIPDPVDDCLVWTNSRAWFFQHYPDPSKRPQRFEVSWNGPWELTKRVAAVGLITVFAFYAITNFAGLQGYLYMVPLACVMAIIIGGYWNGKAFEKIEEEADARKHLLWEAWRRHLLYLADVQRSQQGKSIEDLIFPIDYARLEWVRKQLDKEPDPHFASYVWEKEKREAATNIISTHVKATA